MKSTPFNPETDYAPIPFDRTVCQTAQELKSAGLAWQPQVGCFVWDPDEHIDVPSPFPNRIYFILNLNHFVRIFGNVERIAEKLVWLPTWHQARIILHKQNTDSAVLKTSLNDISTTNMSDDLRVLYQLILNNLESR